MLQCHRLYKTVSNLSHTRDDVKNFVHVCLCFLTPMLSYDSYRTTIFKNSIAPYEKLNFRFG